MCVIATALAVVGVYCQSKSGKAKHNAQHDGEVLQNHQNGHIQEHTDWLYQADKESPTEIIHVCASTYLLRKPYGEDVTQRYPSNEDEVDQHNNALGKISEQENTSTCSSIPWIEYMSNDGTETSNLETDSQSNRNTEDQQNYGHGEMSNQENSSRCGSIPWKEYVPNDDRIIEDQQNDDVFVEATDAIRNLTVKEGESVTLGTDVTTIKEDDVILWTFAESKECNQTVEFKTIAERTKANKCEYLCGYKRFGDRLQLDIQTGSLTVTNIRCVDAGLYKLCMPRKKTWKTFIVAVKPTIQRRNTVE
ncbi:uncharacterized protein LOC130430752 isoform X2 [Triplophysa dalaica]|uniref:uncharacterized protein LOC130430752 isoform X2 n=1 Tax=Triplophysa dalaica TaxID=1582913 RepID=UPI0024DF8299|nr:uncharacterized protein LOC130430752 isoform X2 [Triplophysa dalaica]